MTLRVFGTGILAPTACLSASLLAALPASLDGQALERKFNGSPGMEASQAWNLVRGRFWIVAAGCPCPPSPDQPWRDLPCAPCFALFAWSVRDDPAWSCQQQTSPAHGKGAVAARFSKWWCPAGAAWLNDTRTVTGKGQHIPAKPRVVQLRRKGGEGGGSGKHPAFHRG